MNKVDPRLRIWLDSWTLNNAKKEWPGSLIDKMEEYIFMGFSFVTAETILDMRDAQQDIEYMKFLVAREELIIERWYKSVDDMFKKPFEFSSSSFTAPAVDSFKKLAPIFPGYADVLPVKDLVERYGIPRGEWEEGPYNPPEPLSEELKKATGLKEAATRTEVLKACKATGVMHLFSKYNKGYIKGLAIQHNCDCIMNMSGFAESVY